MTSPLLTPFHLLWAPVRCITPTLWHISSVPLVRIRSIVLNTTMRGSIVRRFLAVRRALVIWTFAHVPLIARSMRSP